MSNGWVDSFLMVLFLSQSPKFACIHISTGLLTSDTKHVGAHDLLLSVGFIALYHVVEIMEDIINYLTLACKIKGQQPAASTSAP
jgi:hypothetical protein